MAVGVSKTHYLEQKMIEAVLRGNAYASAAAVYAALFTTDPTDQGGGVEVSAGGTAYARQPITFAASTNNGAQSGSSTSNSAAITFAIATADYGTVSAIGIFDAATNGNLLYYGSLTVTQYVRSGDQVVIPIGDLVVAED